MAKYSMELGEMLENPLTPLFHFDYDFYCDDALIRKKFEQKFIDHYFFHEIGCETHARWTQMLKARLNLIMPYYKQLYETELKSKNIEFLLNKDYTETFIRELDRTNRDEMTSSVTGETTLNNQGETTSSTTVENTSSSQQNEEATHTQNGKLSSINDGVSSVALSDGYLTEVTQTILENQGQSVTNETQSQTTSSSANSNDVSQSSSTNQQNTSTNGESGERETHTIIGKGNIGITSSAELLSKWRDVLINIDRLIIDECQDLFMLIY